MYHNIGSLYSHLGESICSVLPAFHALTGCDFTQPFFGRSKYAIFKRLVQSPSSADLLRSLSSCDVDFKEVIDFVLHSVYSRPKTEKTPGDSRYVMLFPKEKSERKKRKRLTDTRRIPPDEASLTMKIKRTNYITLNWINSLNWRFKSPNVLEFGWTIGENDEVTPTWYEGEPLPSESELQNYLAKKKIVNTTNEETEESESESESDDE